MYFRNIVQQSIFILYITYTITYAVGITMNFANTKGMSIIEFNKMISSLHRLLRLNLYNLTINAYFI